MITHLEFANDTTKIFVQQRFEQKYFMCIESFHIRNLKNELYMETGITNINEALAIITNRLFLNTEEQNSVMQELRKLRVIIHAP